MARSIIDFRSTADGTGPNSPYNEAAPYAYSIGGLYPVNRNGLTFGWTSSPTKSDYSGTDKRLSGRNGSNSSANFFRLDVAPGKYRIYCALGTLTTTGVTGMKISDASGELARVGQGNPKVPASVAAGSVMDASGAVITMADWLAANDAGTDPYVEVTTTGTYLLFSRIGTASEFIYLANLQVETVVQPLVDILLSKEDGAPGTPSTYSKEPEGKPVGRLSTPNGAQAYSIDPGDEGYSYFTVAANPHDDGQPWLYHSATRLPYPYTAGVRVKQTDGARSRKTLIALPVLDAGNRAVTGREGQKTSLGLKMLKDCLTVVEGESWPGVPADTTFAVGKDFAFASLSAFQSWWNGFTPDGTSLYRVRVQGTLWTGTLSLGSKSFGTGGLLVTPDAGHDPILKVAFTDAWVDRAHWKGIRWAIPTGAGGTDGIGFKADLPPTGIYPCMVFEDCRAGAAFDASYSLTDWDSWGTWLDFMFVRQITVRNCLIWGVENCYRIMGGRIWDFIGSDYQLVVRDMHALTTAYRIATPRGVFTDDYTYVRIDGNTGRHNPDIYDPATMQTGGTPHSDMVQTRRLENAYPPSAGLNYGSSSWYVGLYTVNVAERRLYRVKSVTVDGNGKSYMDPANPPSGTGSTIVSGSVTFEYLQPYNLPTKAFFVITRNAFNIRGTKTNAESNPAAPGLQFIIDSNLGFGNDYYWMVFDNISCSGTERGITTDGEVFAEGNTFSSASTAPTYAGGSVGMDRPVIRAKRLRSWQNVIGATLDNKVNLSATESLMVGQTVPVNYLASAIPGLRPTDVFEGAFSLNAAGDYQYPTLRDDGTDSQADYRSSLSRQLHPKASRAGGRMREVRTIEVTDAAGVKAQTTLVVA